MKKNAYTPLINILSGSLRGVKKPYGMREKQCPQFVFEEHKQRKLTIPYVYIAL